MGPRLRGRLRAPPEGAQIFPCSRYRDSSEKCNMERADHVPQSTSYCSILSSSCLRTVPSVTRMWSMCLVNRLNGVQGVFAMQHLECQLRTVALLSGHRLSSCYTLSFAQHSSQLSAALMVLHCSLTGILNVCCTCCQEPSFLDLSCNSAEPSLLTSRTVWLLVPYSAPCKEMVRSM